MRKFFAIALFALFVLTTGNALSQGTVVSLTGTVADEVTRKPISVEITVTDSRNVRINKVKSNSADGYYYITGLKPNQSYRLTLANFNYFKEEVTITVPPTDKYLEISKDLLLKPLVENIKIPLLVPPFEVNQSKIRFGADFIVDEIKSSLKMNQTVKMEILCFPDSDKGAEANLELTQARAKAIKDYLVAGGIKEDRISISGSAVVDERNPPPTGKASKGKRYIGFTYLVIKGF